MQRDYEILLLTPVSDATYKEAVEKSKEILSTVTANVTGEKDLGIKRLAYDIDDQRDGHYHIVNFTLEPEKIAELERLLKLEESLMRFMVSVVEKKQKEQEAKREG